MLGVCCEIQFWKFQLLFYFYYYMEKPPHAMSEGRSVDYPRARRLSFKSCQWTTTRRARGCSQVAVYLIQLNYKLITNDRYRPSLKAWIALKAPNVLNWTLVIQFFFNKPEVGRAAMPAVNPLRIIERVCDQHQLIKHSLFFLLKKSLSKTFHLEV